MQYNQIRSKIELTYEKKNGFKMSWANSMKKDCIRQNFQAAAQG